MNNLDLKASAFGPEWWRVTLSSIGDAVIATDTAGRIAFMNRIAETLTGWRESEALGRLLSEVFVIVNESTRAPVENPVAKVLKSGQIVGLANHTVLINRAGKTVPIDDSAAPIRDQNGTLLGVVLVFRDISDRRRTEIAHAYVAAIVESSEDAIIGKNLQGIITSWNPGAQRIFGYTAEGAVGQSIMMIIPSDRQDEERDIIARLRRGERTDHFETVRMQKDGSLIDISLTVSPIRDAEGTIVGASKTARNITERKAAQRERERLLALEQAARTKAEEANRLKDEFLATLSHELRTPLNSILGWATLLRSGNVNAAQAQQALETIERNARTQAKLIDDLLDVSRIITGKLRLELRPVMGAEVVESAIAAVKPMAEAKGVRLQSLLDPDAGPVSADAARLQQVVWNLLTNAIKFTPKGGRVQVRVERSDSHVEIVVSDTGQGVPSAFLPHVFDRFRQADSGSTRQHGGLGLGLAIVRHLVELHGGSITAESPGEGHGATFAVQLPLMSAGRIDADDQERRRVGGVMKDAFTLVAPPNLADVRVLIVDDEDDTRKLLRSLIEKCGASVHDVTSAALGFEEVKRWRPTIILSDIGMPDEDGYEFIAKVRKWEKASGTWTPAVALTAYARAEDRVRALAAGYQIHVAKPIEPAELVLVVASQLGRGSDHTSKF